MTVPRLKVMRLEMMLNSKNDCGVMADDVGAAAMAGVREVWRRVMMARCVCYDAVVRRMSRNSEDDGAAECARTCVELKQLAGEGGRV